MPMILCHKIRDGKLVETAIDVSAIKGMEESSKPLNGTNVKCTKVYASAGHFYIFATPTQLYGAKQAAILENKDVKLVSSAQKYLPIPKKQFVPNKYKMLGGK